MNFPRISPASVIGPNEWLPSDFLAFHSFEKEKMFHPISAVYQRNFIVSSILRETRVKVKCLEH
jgi:hypothetical protein